MLVAEKSRNFMKYETENAGTLAARQNFFDTVEQKFSNTDGSNALVNYASPGRAKAQLSVY